MIIDSASTTGSSSASSANLGLQDFMKILMTQLTYQDPLKPMDNKEFMAQMAQFTNLEQTQQLNDKMAALLTNQASLQSVGLIGRTVDLPNQDGSVTTGVVTALSLAGSSPQLTIRTTAGATLNNVALSQVSEVR